MKYKIVIDKQSRTNPSSEKKEYEVDIEELRVRRDIYDSIVITREEAYVLRKLQLMDLNVLKILDEPIKEPLKDIKITLFEGDNYIYLVDVYGNKIYAEYLVKNEFNELYVTVNEMNSAINQSAQSIELNVNQKLTGYSTTEEMNSAINMKAGEISSVVSKKVGNDEIASVISQTPDKIYFKSNNFGWESKNSKMTTDGKITATGGEIGGFDLSSTKFKKDLNGAYDYNKYDLLIAASIVMEWLTSFSTDIYDVNNDGKINSSDFLKIKQIINKEIQNTKNIKGTFEINSENPKNCISVSKNGEMVVSIGVGGINSNIITALNMICGNMYGTSTQSFKGVMINGEKPIILCQDASDSTSGSYMTPNEIATNTLKADLIQELGYGYAMCGRDTGHKYKCDWTGTQLQFWVDNTNVGTLSDKRLKTEIQDIDDDFIKIIDEVEMKQFKVANRNGLISFGILAQDLIEIFGKYNKNPFDYEIVQKTQYKIDDETIYYTINYEQFLILKQKSTDIKLQKQQEQINMLVKEIQELKGVNNGKD